MVPRMSINRRVWGENPQYGKGAAHALSRFCGSREKALLWRDGKCPKSGSHGPAAFWTEREKLWGQVRVEGEELAVWGQGGVRLRTTTTAALD